MSLSNLTKAPPAAFSQEMFLTVTLMASIMKNERFPYDSVDVNPLRCALVLLGLSPTASLKNRLSIIAATMIVARVALSTAWKWKSFG